MGTLGDRLGSTLFPATRELARQPVRDLLGAVVAGFVVGLLMPMRRVAGADPAMVFRGADA